MFLRVSKNQIGVPGVASFLRRHLPKSRTGDVMKQSQWIEEDWVEAKLFYDFCLAERDRG